MLTAGNPHLCKKKTHLRKLDNLTMNNKLHKNLPITTHYITNSIAKGVPFRGAASFDRWLYYTITVLQDALEVTVNETYNNYAVGLVWVRFRSTSRLFFVATSLDRCSLFR
jgi:hypothetical protein